MAAPASIRTMLHHVVITWSLATKAPERHHGKPASRQIRGVRTCNDHCIVRKNRYSSTAQAVAAGAG